MLNIDMLNDRSLRIVIVKDEKHLSPTWVNWAWSLCNRLPERKWHADGYFSVPMTEPNYEYILANFKKIDIALTPDAKLMFDTYRLTYELAQKREQVRWKYLFEDVVPTPTYDFYTAPYKHQIVANETLKGQEFFALFMDMGTGKTKVIIDEALSQSKLTSKYKVLVVCPKTVYKAWEDDIKKHLPADVTRHVVRLRLGLNAVDQLIEFVRSKAQIKFALINYERVNTIIEALKMIEFDLGVLDESTKIKSDKSSRTKACFALREHLQRRVVMSGNPVPNSLFDLWAQFEFLSPGLLGYSTKYAFSNRYAEVRKVKAWTETTGYRRLDELKNRIAKYSFIVKKEQCLDLPEKVYETRYIEMGKVQRQMYDDMCAWFIAALESEANERSKGVEATATIAKFLRLSQIANGFFKDTITGEGTIQIPDGDGKIKELLTIIKEEINENEKILVWARFRHDHKVIAEALEKAGISHSVLNGSTKAGDRDRIIDSFNSESGIRVLIGEAGTGGMGLTLLGSDKRPCRTVVYYSNDYSLDKRLQSEDRNHRIGQHYNVTYIDLVAEQSIDTHISERLQQKKDFSEYMTDVKYIKEILLSKNSL